ncbi:MAG: glycosyltransferase [Acidobacteria bacterium]|nr:glycosyltransferase [Acidobacteriota bacterium]
MSISIVHLITGLGTGGAETMLFRLLSRTNSTIYSPTVISLLPCRGLKLTKAIEDLGIPVRSVEMPIGPGLLWKLPRLVRMIRAAVPEIIMGWEVHGNLFSQLSRLLTPSRLVWNVRGSLDNVASEKRRTRMLISALGVASRLPDRIVYNSRRSALQHEAAGFSRDRTVVIPNGFDGDSFRPDAEARSSVRRELNVPSDHAIVGMVGRAHAVKNHRGFLSAMARVAGRSPFHAVLIGRGVDSSNAGLVRQIAESGLPGRVHLLGERADIPRLTAAFDVAVSASLAEAFPNVVGEAMACGVPCLVTDVGDSAWMVGDTGVVVRPEDEDAMARGIERLLRMSVQDRIQLGRAARCRILSQFSLHDVAERFDQLYSDVLSGATTERRGC